MKKKIAFDMLLNIVATAIPTLVLQLLILPALAHNMNDDSYGLIVTILALMNIVPATMGIALNNMRLIMDRDQDYCEDYNVILLIMAAINLILVTAASIYYDRRISFIRLFLTLLLSLLWLLREYYIVDFRLKINYEYIFISNVLLTLGYGIGFIVFRLTNQWQYICIVGQLACLLFIISKSKLWMEPLTISSRFHNINFQTCLLIASSFLARITTYADKLLIFPILGGATVSVYHSATLLGKVVSMAITPISSVALTYLSKTKSKNDSTFKTAFSISTVVCVIMFFICVGISRPILRVLYPQFVDAAMNYIFITTGTMVLTVLTTVINPFILKYYDMKWQVRINGVYAVSYLFIVLLLLQLYGLYGFCVGALLAAAGKLIFTVMIYYRKQEKNT